MRRTILICLAIAVVTSCGSDDGRSTGPRHMVGSVTFSTAGGEVRTALLPVADTEETRARGLMGVRQLPANGGMLFVFDGSTTSTFWMKDTLIPLSIAFIGKTDEVVDIVEMTPCTQEPCPTYASSAPYDRALEMNAGWFSRRGVQIGDAADVVTGTE